MFTEWLIQQVGIEGPVGRAATIAWNEVNNGMAPRSLGVMRWRDHLHHRLGPKVGDEVFKDFLEAYFAFNNEAK